MLSQPDLEHGMEIFNINNEKITEDGHFLRTRPTLDSDDTVTPCGAFTHSKDYPPNATNGPTASVRAFEFGSVCGLELSIPSPRYDKFTVWITACLGKQVTESSCSRY